MGSSTIIGSVFAELGIDTAAFDQGLKKSLDGLGKIDVGKGINAGLADVKRSLSAAAGATGAFGAALGGLGFAGVAAAAAVAEGFIQVRQALAFGDEISDTAAKIAVTTDALQEYRYAVHQLGGEYNDADEALRAFSEKYGAALSKFSAKSLKPFQQLGLDPATLGSTDAALRTVLNKISQLSSTAEQAHIAEKLGISGLLPVARAGTERLDELRQAAHNLGFVMDKDLVDKASTANDRFEDLSKVIDVQFKSAFVEAAPAILTVTEHLATLLVTVGKFANSDGVKAFLEVAKVAVLHASSLAKGAVGDQVGSATDLQAATDESRRAIFRATLGNINGGMEDDPALIRQRMAVQDANKPTGGTRLAAGTKPTGPTAAGDAEAIAAARKEELAAQISITEAVAELAVLKKAEVAQELEEKNAKARKEIGKSISAEAAAEVIKANIAAAAAKDAAIDRDAAEASAQAAQQHYGVLAQYRDQVAQAEAGLARSAAERAQIDEAALVARQEAERNQLAADLLDKVTYKGMAESEAAQELAAQKAAQAAELRAKRAQDAAAISDEAFRRDQDALSLQLQILDSQGQAAETEAERLAVSLRILDVEGRLEKSKLDQVIASSTASKAEKDAAREQLAALGAIQANRIRATVGGMLTNFDRVSGAIGDMGSAFRAHDWARAAEDLVNAIVFAETALRQVGGPAGLGALAGLGAGVGQLIGGKGGSLISSGLNGLIAGSTLGASLASGAAGAALANGVVGLGGSAALAGTLGSGLTAIAPFLGPIGAIAGVALALTSILKGKPSNHGAGLALTPDSLGALSGNKRDADTEKAVTTAGTAILAGEKDLATLGVKTAATVAGLVLGTRDATQIYLSNGKTLTSAVGDAAAATETALKALFDGATYANDAQKTLVEGMLAAGKSFDEIDQALTQFNQGLAVANALPDQLSALIKKITDPNGAELDDLKAQQAARRKAAQDDYKNGLLTAEAFAKVTAALDTLDAKELGQLFQKFTDAASQAADRANADAASKVSSAQQEVLDAYRASASAYEDTVKRFGALADQLDGYGRSLVATSAGGGVTATLAAARAEFQRVAGLAARGDETALGQLQSAGDAFIAASKAGSADAGAFGRDVATVRAAVTAGSIAAKAQVSAAQAQLQALKDQVAGLVQVDADVKDVVGAIGDLNTALADQAAIFQAGLASIAAATARFADNAATATAAVAQATQAASSAPSFADQVSAAVVDALGLPIAQMVRVTGAVAEQWDAAVNGGIPLKVAVV
ncbi:MAG TPA: hypothetical protein VFH92_14525 [Phenylobacterium sp.]|nr:hypothetical protein [Phenylobacterium sp.]